MMKADSMYWCKVIAFLSLDSSVVALELVNGIGSWLQGNGGYISNKIEVFNAPGIGYGLRAIERIHPHETLCAVPKELSMFGKGSDALSCIAAQLAAEKLKGESSSFYPFLRTLPPRAADSGMPAVWSDTRLRRMIGASVADDARKMRQDWIDQQKDYAMHNLKQNVDIDQEQIDNWLWARATLQCRAYAFPLIPKVDAQFYPKTDIVNGDSKSNIPVTEKDASALLVGFLPYITLANHYIPPPPIPGAIKKSVAEMGPVDDECGPKYHCSVELGNGITQPSTSFVLRCGGAGYRRGQEICTSYGQLSFQQKLLSFGWLDKSRTGYLISDALQCSDKQVGGGDGSDNIDKLLPLDPSLFCITPLVLPVMVDNKNKQVSNHHDGKSHTFSVELKTFMHGSPYHLWRKEVKSAMNEYTNAAERKIMRLLPRWNARSSAWLKQQQQQLQSKSASISQETKIDQSSTEKSPKDTARTSSTSNVSGESGKSEKSGKSIGIDSQALLGDPNAASLTSTEETNMLRVLMDALSTRQKELEQLVHNHKDMIVSERQSIQKITAANGSSSSTTANTLEIDEYNNCEMKIVELTDELIICCVELDAVLTLYASSHRLLQQRQQTLV